MACRADSERKMKTRKKALSHELKVQTVGNLFVNARQSSLEGT